MEIWGNIANIKKSILLRIEALENVTVPRHLLVSPELARELAYLTKLINEKEIAIYIDRQGNIRNIMLGDKNSASLIEDHLYRNKNRLSGLRCIHTHPSGNSTISTLDLTCLNQYRLDCMAAIGTKDGKVISISAAFLQPGNKLIPGQNKSYQFFGPFTCDQIEDFPFMEILNDIEKIITKSTDYFNDSQNNTLNALLVGFNKQKGALLTGEESLEELEELSKTAGLEVINKVVINIKKPDTAFYIGTGKVKDFSLYRQQNNIGVIVFDEELSPRQQSNLEDNLGCSIIDRTALILQIFADRARTKEGKLQVELAQLNYLLPRLIGRGNDLSRLGGGIGTRGPGETKLETDRRKIYKRISTLKKQILEIKKQRNILRKQREKNSVPVIALVGYTNAGKSSLLNILTTAEVFSEDKLFATLDPTTRRLELEGGELLITDTVGFIQKLPTQLVAAFQATLEEIQYADILLHVIDTSNSAWQTHITAVDMILKELGIVDKPTIYVFNKWDLVDDPADMEVYINKYKPALSVSARNGTNIDPLLNLIYEHLPEKLQIVQLLLPYSEASLLNALYNNCTVEETEYRESGIYCTACLNNYWQEKMKRYIC